MRSGKRSGPFSTEAKKTWYIGNIVKIEQWQRAGDDVVTVPPTYSVRRWDVCGALGVFTFVGSYATLEQAEHEGRRWMVKALYEALADLGVSVPYSRDDTVVLSAWKPTAQVETDGGLQMSLGLSTAGESALADSSTKPDLDDTCGQCYKTYRSHRVDEACRVANQDLKTPMKFRLLK